MMIASKNLAAAAAAPLRFCRVFLYLRPALNNLVWPIRGQPTRIIWHRGLSHSQGRLTPASRLYSTYRPLSQRITEERNHASLTDPLTDSLDTTLVPKDGKITCAYFDGSGTMHARQKDLTKNEIAQQFELRHRDLRDIDLKSEAVTRILVRPATILLQFFDLCLIVQANEALLINLQKAGTDRSSVSYPDFESRLSGVKEVADVPELPYELRAVEAAIVAVLSNLRKDLIEIKQEAEHDAQQLKLESGFAAVGLDHLFEHSRRLGKIEQKARMVRDTIREVLDTDEDLAGMYLSDQLAGRPHQVSDHQEAEYMLEDYHKAADGLVESAHAVISTLRKKENTFRSSLAVQRNQIMFLEARLAIHTLGVAAGTLVAGLFGMNLVNYLEDAPYGFAAITGVCVIVSASFSMYGMRGIKKIQTLKGIQDQRFTTMNKKI